MKDEGTEETSSSSFHPSSFRLHPCLSALPHGRAFCQTSNSEGLRSFNSEALVLQTSLNQILSRNDLHIRAEFLRKLAERNVGVALHVAQPDEGVVVILLDHFRLHGHSLSINPGFGIFETGRAF